MSQLVRWHGFADAPTLQQEAFARILRAADAAIAARGRFDLVLAGGSTPQAVYRLLRDAQADWSRWWIWYGDERCLARDDPERNSHMAAINWLDHVAIDATQIRPIAAELGAQAGARDYAQVLQPLGWFDLVLLGLGEDGHTASLFPGRDVHGDGSASMIAVLDAPKPPAQRISMSATRLSQARAVVFLVSGESKREAVQRWREGADIPARTIAPAAGVDVLIEQALLDSPAAPALP